MPAHSPEETHALLVAAFNARDADALAELYEEDAALVVPPDGHRVSGRDAIRAAVGPALALGGRFRSEVVESLEADGLALTHVRWSLVAESESLAGRGAVVHRRQPDGSWRIVLDNPVSPG